MKKLHEYLKEHRFSYYDVLIIFFLTTYVTMPVVTYLFKGL